MNISEIRALQIQVRSFLATLEKEAGGGDVSTSLASYYNSLLQRAATYPSLAPHLPPTVRETSDFPGVASVTTTELKVYLNHLMAMTDMLEEAHGT